MGEEFKKQIEARIDSAVDRTVESSNTEKERLEQFKKQTETLRESLKKSILQDNILDEDTITDDEWQEIIDSLPKDLLAEFGIQSRENLKVFLVGEEKSRSPTKGMELKEKEVEKYAREIIDGKFSDLCKFMRETIRTLTPKSIGEVLYEVALAGKLKGNDHYFEVELFKESPLVSKIFIQAGKSDIYQAFIQFDEIAKYPWAVDVLVETAKYGNSKQIRDYLKGNYAKGLTEADKKRIIEALEGRERNLPIAKLVINRELHANSEDDHKLNEVLLDPALSKISQIKLDWILSGVEAVRRTNSTIKMETIQFDVFAKSKTLSPSYLADFQAVIARNLYFQNQEVNESNVKKEVKRIMETRKRYRDIPIFAGRNVILAAHLEKKESDQFGDLNRFGKKALVERIKKDGGIIDGVLRPEETFESLKRTKQKILDSVKNTQPPFTFIFQGHGGPDALYLSDGQTKGIGDANKIKETEKTVKISVDDLFQAYKVRQEKFGDKIKTPKTRDIFIDGGCFNSNFIRNFYLMCEKEGIQKPIFTGESEYGQYGYSEYDSKYGDNFFDQLFNSSETEKAVLGNIIDNDVLNRNSNPSFYIPDNQNKTMQIAENQRDDLMMAA